MFQFHYDSNIHVIHSLQYTLNTGMHKHTSIFIYIHKHRKIACIYMNISVTLTQGIPIIKQYRKYLHFIITFKLLVQWTSNMAQHDCYI